MTAIDATPSSNRAAPHTAQYGTIDPANPTLTNWGSWSTTTRPVKGMILVERIATRSAVPQPELSCPNGDERISRFSSHWHTEPATIQTPRWKVASLKRNKYGMMAQRKTIKSDDV